MIALFGDLALMEILVIAALSVMVFGRDLPRVAAQAFSKFQKARRALMKVWRESGIGEEVRQLQREIERGSDAIKRANPRELARQKMREVESQVKSPFESVNSPESNNQPDANHGLDAEAQLGPLDQDSIEEGGEREARPAPLEDDYAADPEPAGEAQRRPPWYPETTGADDVFNPESRPFGDNLTPEVTNEPKRGGEAFGAQVESQEPSDSESKPD